MAKITEPITETFERERVVSIVCDWCKEQSPKLLNEGDNKRWEFELTSMLTVSSYSDGWVERGWMVEDLCPACQIRLHDLLKENGITITPFKDE